MGSQKVSGIPRRRRMRDKISYRLDRALLVISTCKFCRGCMMQFGGSGATSGRASDFFITITHRATDRLLCSNSLVRKKSFLSSPNHCTLWISLRVGVSHSENGPQGDTFCNHGGHHIECDGWSPEDYKRSLPPVLPNNGRIDGASVRARKGPT
jgi:hypothetical protein